MVSVFVVVVPVMVVVVPVAVTGCGIKGICSGVRYAVLVEKRMIPVDRSMVAVLLAALPVPLLAVVGFS